MHRLTLFIVILFIILMMVSCGSKTGNTVQALKYPDHSSVNALDWNGVYKGTLPCADCEGIETHVTLTPDNTYTLKRIYLRKENDIRESSGTFTWNSDGNRIMFDGNNGWYQVTENRLIHLDKSGNRVTGPLAEKYILLKQ
jgi:copper homeostasis protein (lipoprotein)